MTWVDPETVTSLIEVSGASSVARRPGHAAAAGWPVLLSADVALEWLDGTSGSIEDALAGRPIEVSELGDPGSVLEPGGGIGRPAGLHGTARAARRSATRVGRRGS